MPADKSQQMGLRTDDPPDRLTSNAMDLRNVAPRSGSSIIARGGTSLVGHYQAAPLGRNIMTDALPNDLGMGVMIVVCNTTAAAGGTAAHQIDGIFAFRPRLQATLYDAVAGQADNNELFLLVET